jgi:prepilin-type N-terminal cleavage/methylation domain-containing protein
MNTQKIRKAVLNRHGFTLTELIVVVVLLAILGTVGFLSMQGFSSKSRDSNRAISLKQIQS